MEHTNDTNDRREDTAVNRADDGWTKSELERVDLGDCRLERRLRFVAEDLSRQPEYPINVASNDAASTKAAYRLFANERVTAEKILSCHQKKTLSRMQHESVVLAIQDTSYLNFTNHKKTRGLGPIGDSSAILQGLILHSTFAVTPRGLPLGVLSHDCWARDGFLNSDETSADRPLVEKESFKWIKALREVTNLPTEQATTVVHVADRECDIYEFLREAHGINAKYLIRACQDRCLESSEYAHVQEYLKSLQPQALIELDVPTQKRKATLEVRFSSITLKAPGRITKIERLPINCWVVQVSEPNPPPGSEPLSWTLLTNLPVTTVEQALEKISWYRRRWAIEEFHKILKSGCAVEDCRLQTAERLKRYVALFCLIAWRIFWMVHISRADPAAPAELVLTNTEIMTICTLERFSDKKLSPHRMTVRQAILAIAALGGHLARRLDPPPGCTALWRGWQRLASMTELYESMANKCG
jgi:hypothetical protein